jgi:hypothetical protein
MRTFSVFLILVGILSFLSIFGMMSVTFGIIIGIFFGAVFAVEGTRELVKGNLIGVGGILFSIFIFVKIIFACMSFGQIFLAFIASYSVAIGLHMLFKRRPRMDFWKD